MKMYRVDYGYGRHRKQNLFDTMEEALDCARYYIASQPFVWFLNDEGKWQMASQQQKDGPGWFE